MTKYIDADALIGYIEQNTDISQFMIKYIRGLIREQPTIDAAPIRRGTWSEEYDPNDDAFFRRKFRCSACGGWNTYGFTKYCPDCGAKMENAGEYDAEKE